MASRITLASEKEAQEVRGCGCPSLSLCWLSWLLLPCLKHVTTLCLPSQWHCLSLSYQPDSLEETELAHGAHLCRLLLLLLATGVSLENSLQTEA